MNYSEMALTIRQIQYKPGWSTLLSAGLSEGGRPYIQVCVSEEAEASMSPITGIRSAWKGGKVYLSEHMCKQELVAAVFGAYMKAEEHESREWFKYRNARIFNPHLDPDKLADFARKAENYEFRENAMNPE